MSIFSKIYIALWIALIAVEVFAATTSYAVLDTMSENYWWLQEQFPPLAYITTIGLVVLWFHLVMHPGKIQ